MPRTIRPIRVEGNIAYVPLTRGYEATIDAEMVEIVGQWNWYAKLKPHTVYAVRQEYLDGAQHTLGMHSFLLGEKNGFVTDHKNGNGLDNRLQNLRHATKNQNGYNCKRSKLNTSGHKGVHWVATHNKWRAMIRCDKNRIFLGYFNCPTSAALAYASASLKLHRDFGTIRS
jgi:hypothetical protein